MATAETDFMRIIDPELFWCCNYKGTAFSFGEFLELIRSFHGYPAPGLVIAGKMIQVALEHLPKGILFDVISETGNCLPDAVQLLTPCTIGNNWLKILNFKKFAVSLYDKTNGNGYRVWIDPEKLDSWKEIHCWFFKTKPKFEQNTPLLYQQIQAAGADILSGGTVCVDKKYLIKKSFGKRAICPICHEVFPAEHGRICHGCQGHSPYTESVSVMSHHNEKPLLETVSVEACEGKVALHDMTQIIAGEFKGPVFRSGQKLGAGDICRLQMMGKQNIYVADEKTEIFDKETHDDLKANDQWIHENEAARRFAKAMAGEGVTYDDLPVEGKIDFIAERDGLLNIDTDRLEAFNLVPDVMCATRKGFSIVTKGRKLGGTRAIPLYLSERILNRAMETICDAPILTVLPMKKADVGVLVTGTEIFRGLVQDRFIPIIQSKISRLGCRIIHSIIAPDDRGIICDGIKNLINSGANLIVTTAGLSVDPDDVTRRGLMDAGARDILYGAPILPGAMTLLAHIGSVPLIGVPACALYYPTTSFDLLLPRLLADIPITRRDLAKLGHGAFCWQCKTCQFPKCSFGKA